MESMESCNSGRNKSSGLWGILQLELQVQAKRSCFCHFGHHKRNLRQKKFMHFGVLTKFVGQSPPSIKKKKLIKFMP